MPSHLFIANSHSKFVNVSEEVGKALTQELACGLSSITFELCQLNCIERKAGRDLISQFHETDLFTEIPSEEGSVKSSTRILEMNEAKQELRWKKKKKRNVCCRCMIL